MKAPLLFEMNKKRVLVVGLGTVGVRRAKTFAKAGALVTAIARKPDRTLEVEGITVVCANYSSDLLKDIDIAVAATNDHDLNALVLEDCKARGIPVNAADDPERSDYFFPSVIRRGDLTLSVCTEGASPMTTISIVKALKAEYGPEYAERLAYLRTLRDDIIDSISEESEKKAKLRALIDMSTETLGEQVKAIKRRNMKTIIVGSRGSKLARVQTEWLLDRLREANPDVDFELRIISTKGDRVQNKALDAIGDKGLFTKELEEALLSGDIDMAVHSMKDMPSTLPEGLTLAAPPVREDPSDVLVTHHQIESPDELPQGAKVGTGSKRRAYQLSRVRPDLNIQGIRGNVDTRLRKLADEGFDAIILAAAGMKRIDVFESDEYSVIPLVPDEFVCAPAQGILAVEMREDNDAVRQILEPVVDPVAAVQMAAERKFLTSLDGDCHLPIGAYCKVDGDDICLTGLYGDEEGHKLVKDSIIGKAADAEAIGAALAEKLKKEVNE